MPHRTETQFGARVDCTQSSRQALILASAVAKPMQRELTYPFSKMKSQRRDSIQLSNRNTYVFNNGTVVFNTINNQAIWECMYPTVVLQALNLESVR